MAKFAGQPLERVEDAALLTGRGRFVNDLPVRADTLSATIVRSTHAHAEIHDIDSLTAKSADRQNGSRTGAYHIQNLAINVRVLVTNKMPAGLVRGVRGPR